MKIFKLLLFLSIFLIKINVIAQTDTISTTERLVDKYGKVLVETFNNGIKTVAPYAKEGFIIAVKLNIAKGIAGLLPVIIAITFFYLSYKEYKNTVAILSSGNIPKYMNANGGPWDEDNLKAITVIYLSIALIALIISIFTTVDAILRLSAPEWFAIKDIIELMK